MELNTIFNICVIVDFPDPWPPDKLINRGLF